MKETQGAGRAGCMFGGAGLGGLEAKGEGPAPEGSGRHPLLSGRRRVEGAGMSGAGGRREQG